MLEVVEAFVRGDESHGAEMGRPSRQRAKLRERT